MGILLQDWGSTLTYTLLILAILSLWLIHRPIVNFGLLIAAIICAFAFGRINLWGVLSVISMAAILQQLLVYRKNTYWEWPLFVSGVVATFLLLTHQAPGFNNWKILSEYKISPGVYPFSLYLNFDKTVVGFFILVWTPQIFAGKKSDWKKIFTQLSSHLPLLCVLLFVIAWGINYVTWDVKWPYFSSIWMARNLFMVVVIEEALFRGLIQRFISEKTKTPLFGLVISSLLFGLIHYPGGLKYVLLSITAGFFYGHIFHKTQKIESSILLHFLLNVIHFVFFSYPGLE